MRAARAAAGLAALWTAATGCAEPRLHEDERHHVRCRDAVTADGAAVHMQWLMAAEDAGEAALDAYCAAVGPALVHARPRPAARRVPSDTLVVVAWNVALGAGDVARFIGDVRAGVHTRGRPVRDFVLLLQEAPRGGEAVPRSTALARGAAVSELDETYGPDILEIARVHELQLVYAPSLRNGRGDPPVDHGNAVLATLPLDEPTAYELPAGIRRRVAVGAVLDWPGDLAEPLAVVSVHLDNFSLRRPVGSFGGIRTAQARALREMLPASGPLLLGGDLNTWTRGPGERAFRELRRRLPRPAEPQPEPTATRLFTPRRLDYLLAAVPDAWHFEEWRVAERYGSDHHPVMGMLWRAGGTVAAAAAAKQITGSREHVCMQG